MNMRDEFIPRRYCSVLSIDAFIYFAKQPRQKRPLGPLRPLNSCVMREAFQPLSQLRQVTRETMLIKIME
jgi:hypothetical protein